MKERYNILRPIKLRFDGKKKEHLIFSKGVIEVENNIIYFINVVGRRYKSVTSANKLNDWIEYRFIEEFD